MEPGWGRMRGFKNNNYVPRKGGKTKMLYSCHLPSAIDPQSVRSTLELLDLPLHRHICRIALPGHHPRHCLYVSRSGPSGANAFHPSL